MNTPTTTTIDSARQLAIAAREALQKAHEASISVSYDASKKLYQALGDVHSACARLEWLDGAGQLPEDTGCASDLPDFTGDPATDEKMASLHSLADRLENDIRWAKANLADVKGMLRRLWEEENSPTITVDALTGLFEVNPKWWKKHYPDQFPASMTDSSVIEKWVQILETAHKRRPNGPSGPTAAAAADSQSASDRP